MKLWIKFISSPILLVLGILIFAVGCTLFFNWQATTSINDLNGPLEIVSNTQSKLDSNNTNLSKAEFLELEKLNSIVDGQKEHHKNTFSLVYRYQYTSIMMLSIFSILTLLMTFIMGSKGWQESTNQVRALFLTCICLTAFYTLLIVVYQQDTDRGSSVKSYLKLDNIQKDLVQYCATNSNITLAGDTLEYDDFHHYTMKRIAGDSNIYNRVTKPKSTAVVSDTTNITGASQDSTGLSGVMNQISGVASDSVQ